jgi:hypothetical protein
LQKSIKQLHILVLSLEDAELLGYFSITIKPLVVNAEPFSNTVKRKLGKI